MIDHPTGWRYTMTDDRIEANEEHDTFVYEIKTGELAYDALLCGKVSVTLPPFLSVEKVIEKAGELKQSCEGQAEADHKDFLEEQAYIDAQQRLESE